MNKIITFTTDYDTAKTITTGDIISTTSAEFSYDGYYSMFRNSDEMECEVCVNATLIPEMAEESTDITKNRNGGDYTFHYYKIEIIHHITIDLEKINDLELYDAIADADMGDDDAVAYVEENIDVYQFEWNAKHRWINDFDELVVEY